MAAQHPSDGTADRVPTIRDVAHRAGVSKSLVSLVLQDAPHVSDARRRAVLDAVEALGYRANRHARGLSNARTETVGVLLNDLRNPWFVELLEGLTATLHGAGLSAVIVDSRTDTRIGRSSVDTLLNLGVDGLVVVGTTSESAAIEAAALHLPVVLAGTREPSLPHVDVAVNDDAAGARAATEHLIELGHREIAHLRGPGDVGALRRAGFEAAMRAAGLDPDRYAVSGGMSEESGYAAAARLLDRSERPTAIFAFNDIAGIGVIAAAEDHGLRVPDDLSIVGYDDTALARIRHISLTSVDNGSLAVGVQAATFLIERIRDPQLPRRERSFATELRVRGTTGEAPRANQDARP